MPFLVTCQHFLQWFVKYIILDCTCSTTNGHRQALNCSKVWGPQFCNFIACALILKRPAANYVLFRFEHVLTSHATLPIARQIRLGGMCQIGMPYNAWYLYSVLTPQFVRKGSFCVFLQAVTVSLKLIGCRQSVAGHRDHDRSRDLLGPIPKWKPFIPASRCPSLSFGHDGHDSVQDGTTWALKWYWGVLGERPGKTQASKHIQSVCCAYSCNF